MKKRYSKGKDCLGGCPRIGFFSQIKAFFDNKHRHTPSIPSIIFKK